jgi:hypothetical protein
MADIYNNDISQFPTHFLAGPQLIKSSRELHGLTSENYTYPTMTYLGSPRDEYYAEIWVDGMDWQNTYWLLEQANHGERKAVPFLVFSSIDEEKQFNPLDMHNLFRAMMSYRRNLTGPLSVLIRSTYFDSIWPYLYLVDENAAPNEKAPDLGRFLFTHNSQTPVTFYLNKISVPLVEGFIKRK